MVHTTSRHAPLVLALLVLAATMTVAVPAAASHCYHNLQQQEVQNCRAKAEAAGNNLLYANQPWRFGIVVFAQNTQSDAGITANCMRDNSALVWGECADRHFVDKAGWNVDRVSMNVYLVYTDSRSWAYPRDPGAPPAWVPGVGWTMQCAHPTITGSSSSTLANNLRTCVPLLPN